MTKILIVEDDADINNAVAEYLTARGCSCVQAFSGTEGALQWRAHRPDLVVADLMLPGMTGQQLIAALPAKVFTRQEIYEQVWQQDYFVEDKTINVHISNLRAKLRAAGADEGIETVWGIGFKLKA